MRAQSTSLHGSCIARSSRHRPAALGCRCRGIGGERTWHVEDRRPPALRVLTQRLKEKARAGSCSHMARGPRRRPTTTSGRAGRIRQRVPARRKAKAGVGTQPEWPTSGRGRRLHVARPPGPRGMRALAPRMWRHAGVPGRALPLPACSSLKQTPLVLHLSQPP